MSKELIDQLKRQGIKSALYEAIRSALHDSRQALERAGYENFKHFDKEMKKARTRMVEAEELFKEWKK